MRTTRTLLSALPLAQLSALCAIAALSLASAFSLMPTSAAAQEATHDWGKTYASIARPSKTARCPTGWIASASAQTCETFSLITPKAIPKAALAPQARQKSLACIAHPP